MVTIGISGCFGKMGSRILQLAANDAKIKVGLLLEDSHHPLLSKQLEGLTVLAAPERIKDINVLIEFTSPAATMQNLKYALKYKKGVVIGTTGLTDGQIKKINSASKKIPVCFSPNMSVGVNLLFNIVRTVAQKLGPEYDVEIVESHHKMKKDAPSGTAKRLAEVISNERGKQIPVHSLRVGDVIGDHIVTFAGNAERIELVHRAHSRDVFARGALEAAKWLSGKKPGLYDMSDVLGLK